MLKLEVSDTVKVALARIYRVLEIVDKIGYNANDKAWDAYDNLALWKNAEPKDVKAVKKMIDGFREVDFGAEALENAGFTDEAIDADLETIMKHVKGK